MNGCACRLTPPAIFLFDPWKLVICFPFSYPPKAHNDSQVKTFYESVRFVLQSSVLPQPAMQVATSLSPLTTKPTQLCLKSRETPLLVALSLMS